MDKYEVAFSLIGNVMHVTLTGKFPEGIMHSSENVFQPLIDECKRNNCTKVLIDIRGLEIVLRTLELFRAGEDAVFLGTIGIQVAMVANKEVIDIFFEDVVHNRGGKVGVFQDKEAAFTWLGE